jgi:hypothetical protein
MASYAIRPVTIRAIGTVVPRNEPPPERARSPRRSRLHLPHRAWAVAGRHVPRDDRRRGVPLLHRRADRARRAEFGWTRTWTSGAVSLNLLLFGLTAPFAAALMERFGVRRVASLALCTRRAAGTALTLVMTQVWQLLLLWGVVIGLGTGSIALVLARSSPAAGSSSGAGS